MKFTLYTLTSDTKHGIDFEIFSSDAQRQERMRGLILEDADAPKLIHHHNKLGNLNEAWDQWRESRYPYEEFYSSDERIVEIPVNLKTALKAFWPSPVKTVEVFDEVAEWKETHHQ